MMAVLVNFKTSSGYLTSHTTLHALKGVRGGVRKMKRIVNHCYYNSYLRDNVKLAFQKVTAAISQSFTFSFIRGKQ